MHMKNKAMTGGAIGLVLLGAYFLSNLFNGFGLGPGSGVGTGGKNTDPSKVVNSTKTIETDPVSKVEPPGVELGKVLIVLIDGEDYKVLKAPDANFYDVANYRPASLQRIVDMAKSVEGHEGLKVRIGMRENSTANAEANLRNALLEAGLPRTAIREREETIP
jgi:hypothetical protein